jgi:hypothetical protein
MPLELINLIMSYILNPTLSAQLLKAIPGFGHYDSSTLLKIMRRKRAMRKASKRYRIEYDWL